MTRDELLQALQHNNVQAFLRVIREGESNQSEDAYRLLYGGKLFDSFDKHPTERTYEKFDGEFIKNGKLDYTTAAGAYQFTETTWNDLVRRFGFEDFSPKNQDQGAVVKLADRRALDDVVAGRLDAAIRLLPQEWTSLALPRRKAAAPSIFAAYGGQLAPETEAQPQEVKPMGALIPIVLNLLASALPQLSSLGFGSGSEVAQRNIAAGTLVAQKLVEATNSVNLQEAAEKIQTDPTALQAAKEAVADVVFQLSEAGGGGIEGARKFAAAPDQLPFWKQGAFYISLALIVMPYMLLADTFYVHPDSYDGNLRTQIVTGVMLVISIVGAFWLGSTFGSQRKDAALAAK